jgi:putative DNA primase/helicase
MSEVEFGNDEAPEGSDEALALRFTERHATELRFVDSWSRWLIWDGVRWVTDKTLHAFDLARAVCREAAGEDDGKRATVLASAKTVAAIERLARADRRHAATVDQWDADPWLLNTPCGVVDLQTGAIRPSQAVDYMTKVTAVGPNSSCPIPVWLKFLDHILAGDGELVAFMRRLAGYALTGSTREHSLAFLYGTGANGKSTFLNALTGILGDYHRTAPIETFTASTLDRHPTEFAGLRGARLVTAVETEEGRRWAESRIKTLTGGDPVSARFMRQDFFEFVPQFKLVIAGNHKPGLRSVDEAIRRRLHLVPFSVTIPPNERDREMDCKLRNEWAGILAWVIEGCLEWQRGGLRPPKAVVDATEEYLQGQDTISAWLDERCERDPNAWAGSTELFSDWKKFATARDEFVGDMRTFRAQLEMHRLQPRRRPGKGLSGYQGVRLRE